MKILKQIINELKQTERLTPKQLLALTVYTVVFCAIIALIILGFDLLLQFGLAQFLKI